MSTATKMRESNKAENNKAKIARRVIEVLDFFDDANSELTVMDIVRRYNRPQSSTSELLGSMVELGLLRKDAIARTYTLTPRAAFIGIGGQPDQIRDGMLVRLVDRLALETGQSIVLFSMIATNAQIIYARHPEQSSPVAKRLTAGKKDSLHLNCAGKLLLSNLERSRRDGMLRRLNAEAAPADKFSVAEMVSDIDGFGDIVHDQAGFGSALHISCSLVPGQPDGKSIVLGMIHDPKGKSQGADCEAALRDSLTWDLAHHPQIH